MIENDFSFLASYFSLSFLFGGRGGGSLSVSRFAPSSIIINSNGTQQQTKKKQRSRNEYGTQAILTYWCPHGVLSPDPNKTRIFPSLLTSLHIISTLGTFLTNFWKNKTSSFIQNKYQYQYIPSPPLPLRPTFKLMPSHTLLTCRFPRSY